MYSIFPSNIKLVCPVLFHLASSCVLLSYCWLTYFPSQWSLLFWLRGLFIALLLWLFFLVVLLAEQPTITSSTPRPFHGPLSGLFGSAGLKGRSSFRPSKDLGGARPRLETKLGCLSESKGYALRMHWCTSDALRMHPKRKQRQRPKELSKNPKSEQTQGQGSSLNQKQKLPEPEEPTKRKTKASTTAEQKQKAKLQEKATLNHQAHQQMRDGWDEESAKGKAGAG